VYDVSILCVQVLGTQVVLVNNLPTILPTLVEVMPVLDVAKEWRSTFR
jgi:hypothetical protein